MDIIAQEAASEIQRGYRGATIKITKQTTERNFNKYEHALMNIKKTEVIKKNP